MADPDITVRVALDSDPDDPSPVWTDLTALGRIHYGEGGQPVRVVVGRQDEQAEVKPTEQGWAAKNHDNAFTPRNAASAYYQKWEHGRRCQVRETVDGDTFDLGTGFLSMPKMGIVDPRSSQAVAVTAVDWMGRLEDAPDFEGTLAEYIRSTDEDLVEWFALTEPERPFISTLTDAVGRLKVFGFFDEPVPKEPEELLRNAAADGPPGDDQRYAYWDPAADEEGDAFLGQARLDFDLNIPVGTNQVVACSFWVRTDTPTFTVDPGAAGPPTVVYLDLFGAGPAFTGFSIVDSAFSDAVIATFGGEPGVSVQVEKPGRLERDLWRLITARMDYGSGVCDLWIGADRAYTGTLASSPVADTLTTLELGQGHTGAMGHVQIRVGDSSTWTRDDHIAQHRHGYLGLQRQTVGNRIVTLAGYAGVPATEVDISSAASTPMQVARLASVNPATAIRAAATTGQDLVLTNGAGQITVVPRSQRYNQAVSMSIPFGWIGYRRIEYRPDKPITDVTVRRVNGGTARRVDRAKRSRYGVAGLSVDLDTAIDADPANLASWAAAAHGEMRTRCPSIVLNMLDRSFAERKQLLALKVGDRIELTDLPDGSPEDAPHLIIQGIEHTIGPGRIRRIKFNTSPLLGPDVGDPPPCPVVGDLVATTAVIAY